MKKKIGTINLKPKAPTMRQIERMATAILKALGGPQEAADKLNGETFFVLAYLAACDPDFNLEGV